MTADPVAPTGLADEIAFKLQVAILDGEYPPGTHLHQDDLCARFGVSRTPIREALRKLQAQHLVNLVPNKGATVRVPTRAELLEVYALRAELEGYACELAAANATADGLRTLAAAQEAMHAAAAMLEDGGIGESQQAAFNARITRANERFHGVIHELAANRRLRLILGDLQDYFPKDYVWRAIRSAQEVRALSVDEHERIQSALARQDGAAARRAMGGHIRHAGALLMSYLDERSFWVVP
jgi:DNA-binding GntR family transcriptional regulator